MNIAADISQERFEDWEELMLLSMEDAESDEYLSKYNLYMAKWNGLCAVTKEELKSIRKRRQ